MPTPHRSTEPHRALSGARCTLALALVAGSVAGCALGPNQAQPGAGVADTPTTITNTDTADAAPNAEADALVNDHLRRLRAAADDNAFTLPDTPTTTRRGTTPNATGTLEANAATGNVARPVTIDDDPTVGTSPNLTPAPSTTNAIANESTPRPSQALPPQERIDALALDLADAVTELATAEYTPVPGMIRLATLDLLSPGVFNTAYPGFDRAGDNAVGPQDTLTPDDIALVTAWRDLFEAVRASMDETGADLDTIALAADQLNDAADAWRTLDIAEFRLCTRVEGFGVYDPFPTYDGAYKLLAGRRHALVVYAEVDQVNHTPDTIDGRPAHKVTIDQTLTLFHKGTPHVRADADLVAWRTEPQRIEDTSRRERRDFYTVQVIRLPESLSVGSYRLKLTLRDESTGESAERTVDIDVVADISAFSPGVALAPATTTTR